MKKKTKGRREGGREKSKGEGGGGRGGGGGGEVGRDEFEILHLLRNL